MKYVSDDWRSLPARRRKKYEVEAKQEKERYSRDTVLFTREFKRMFGSDDNKQEVDSKRKQNSNSFLDDDEVIEGDEEEGEDEIESMTDEKY